PGAPCRGPRRPPPGPRPPPAARPCSRPPWASLSMSATGPPRRPRDGTRSLSRRRDRTLLGRPRRRFRRCAHPGAGVRSGGLLAPGRAAATAQVDAGLGQNPMDETVGAAGGGCQGADALAGVVPLLQVRRQLVALGTGHAVALLQGLGHEYLPS